MTLSAQLNEFDAPVATSAPIHVFDAPGLISLSAPLYVFEAPTFTSAPL
jgi:hypothetical protein